MPENNIQQFDVIVEKLIKLGHASFPEAFYADPAVLGLSDEQPSRDELGGAIYSDAWYALDRLIASVAAWLVKEGYLWAYGSTGLQISGKGFGLVPSIISGGEVPLIVKIS